MDKKKIAVIASRLKCVDAISIEAEKWVDKYDKLGYEVHLISGKFGEPVQQPHFQLPEIDYKHPEVRGVKRIVFGAKLDKDGQKAANILLNSLVKRIKGPLKNYLVQNKIDILSIEDALASFKNLPLNMALSEIIKELGKPTISRIHYIPWHNTYFTKHDNIPKILTNLPIKARNVVHVTSTESAKQQLKEKKQLNPRVIPNTIDVDKLYRLDDYNKDFRERFGISKDQLLFLQPTRVKRNKAIEQSIRLVSEINESTKKNHVLMVTGSPVYSRQNYFEEVVKKAKRQGVNVIFANDRVFLARHQNNEQKFYSIEDAYVNADVVIYPSMSDAFGNPVIEAAAYRKPLIVNKYPNLDSITEKGFEFVVMDQKVSNETVSDACEIIMDKKKQLAMIDKNFALLKEHYSSDVLDNNLTEILNTFQQQEGFFSRMASSVMFWGKKDDHKPQKKGHQKKEKFKTSKKGKGRKRQERDLKNRKGGYKEPAPKK